MNSIKTKLISLFGVLVVLICIAMASISYICAKNTLLKNISITYPRIAGDVANTFEFSLVDDLDDLVTLSRSELVGREDRTLEERLSAVVEQMKEDDNIISTGILDLEGNYLSTDNGSLSDFEYSIFFDEMYEFSGMISDPTRNKVTNELVLLHSVLIKYRGETTGILIQVKKLGTFSDYIEYFQLGESGEAFILDINGTYLANKDKELVLNQENVMENYKQDSSLKDLAEIHEKMLNGEKGLGRYKNGDKYYYVGYAPIRESDWSAGIIISEDEILSELNYIKRYSAIGALIIIILGILVVFRFANLITVRVKSASNHLLKFSNGDLSENVQEENIKWNDEISEMTKSMIKMQESLKEMIGKIRLNSQEVDNQSENLSSISEEIAISSHGVSETITDVSFATTNQAESILDIEDILSSFNKKLSSMVKEIQEVDINSREIANMADGSSKEMDVVNNSVIEISNSFNEFYAKVHSLGKDLDKINEITNLINSISEQTNLLALNAAIEAARAGEAGKGFSIVADEIRQLAEQTKVSSENISDLIENVSNHTNTIVNESMSIDEKLNMQTGNINNSIKSFVKIINGVDEIIPKIDRVKNSAQDINKDKDNILERIETLSSTANQISASSEEITAASGEMSSITHEVAESAQILNQMTAEMRDEVNKFKL